MYLLYIRTAAALRARADRERERERPEALLGLSRKANGVVELSLKKTGERGRYARIGWN